MNGKPPTPGTASAFWKSFRKNRCNSAEGLNLGAFDRLEIEGDWTRVIAQVKADRGIFVRATKNPVPLGPLKARPTPMKEHIHNWLTDKMKLAGMLATAAFVRLTKRRLRAACHPSFPGRPGKCLPVFERHIPGHPIQPLPRRTGSLGV